MFDKNHMTQNDNIIYKSTLILNTLKIDNDVRVTLPWDFDIFQVIGLLHVHMKRIHISQTKSDAAEHRPYTMTY